jgi:8-oxo-dGTP pyrophosphatase MutT (NUDIX family)
VNARDEILLLRRARSDTFAPGRWGLPGGHTATGETSEQTVRREMREELGGEVSLRPIRSHGPVRDTLYGGIYEIHLFLYGYDGGLIRLDPEHEEYAWVSRENYRSYAVVDGVDEDLRYLDVWPVAFLNAGKLPPL